ncbi:TonB-dependent receptor [Sulfidibacter corallicola]|uniref:TonB-dependent receptor n=1 Tax=Sulfidibacter corallicola TaxID=2818388 RepID=A0A8A4TCJ3_SULCO|nr:TonB-dependent receptor [Sulfidibacter corallicola]QTD47819.1 TonB-dependent receptor [Sulfidibacter corallicola]
MRSFSGSRNPHNFRFFLSLMTFCLILFWATASTAVAGDDDDAAAGSSSQAATNQSDEEPDLVQVVHERFQVIGSVETAAKEPGSAHYISKEKLEKQSYADIHRILRQLPGVNIQEEDGLGLRPNIGMRGTGVERSQKITLMEDGVLIAPAPYTAPAAYYFPTAARMESFEVLKGAASIKNGPYTNGGVLNMVSTSVPNDFSARLDATGGSYGTREFRGQLGNDYETFGYMVEALNLNSDGFKDLDNGDETGTEVEDYMVKLRFNSRADASIYQSLELKAGKTKQDGDETYLGLTEADFEATPYRRYAGSQVDNIETDHDQIQLRYFVKPTSNVDITTTVYNNDFFRNWHKLEKIAGVSAASVLNDPTTYAEEVAILRGEIDSAPEDLRVRNNRRDYYSRGIQSNLHWSVATASVSHEIEVGLRYHEDEEDRIQDEELFQMVNGNMVLTRAEARGTQANRVSSAEALSFFVQDTISAGNWTFRPGIRFESIDYERLDYSTADPDRSEGPSRVRENDVEVFVPGLGVDYGIDDANRVFAGIHRGFSPPGAGKNQDTEEERSTNFELGYRHRSDTLNAEIIGFFNDYDNLLGAETVSGGGDSAGELFNGGAVEVSGIEASLAYDFGNQVGNGWTVPFSVVYTYTTSEFQSSFDTSFADWSPHVDEGDELPYIPETQYALNLGLGRDNWNVNLSGSYTGEMRTKAGQGAIPAGEGIDDYFVLDASAEVTLFEHYRVFGRVRNLGDEEYIVSRRPYGVRPGLKQTFLFGVSARF